MIRSVRELIRVRGMNVSGFSRRMSIKDYDSGGWVVGDRDSFAKCDPYELRGVPMDRETAQQQLQQTCPKWKLDKDALTLCRTLEFKDTQEMSAFLTGLWNIATNHGHFPLSYSVDFHSHSIQLSLKTKALKGLSYNDFHLALLLDLLNDS